VISCASNRAPLDDHYRKTLGFWLRFANYATKRGVNQVIQQRIVRLSSINRMVNFEPLRRPESQTSGEARREGQSFTSKQGQYLAFIHLYALAPSASG
jgi:hypothetical protein